MTVRQLILFLAEENKNAMPNKKAIPNNPVI
jgi:hypothetical protein